MRGARAGLLLLVLLCTGAAPGPATDPAPPGPAASAGGWSSFTRQPLRPERFERPRDPLFAPPPGFAGVAVPADLDPRSRVGVSSG